MFEKIYQYGLKNKIGLTNSIADNPFRSQFDIKIEIEVTEDGDFRRVCPYRYSDGSETIIVAEDDTDKDKKKTKVKKHDKPWTLSIYGNVSFNSPAWGGKFDRIFAANRKLKKDQSLLCLLEELAPLYEPASVVLKFIQKMDTDKGFQTEVKNAVSEIIPDIKKDWITFRVCYKDGHSVRLSDLDNLIVTEWWDSHCEKELAKVNTDVEMVRSCITGNVVPLANEHAISKKMFANKVCSFNFPSLQSYGFDDEKGMYHKNKNSPMSYDESLVIAQTVDFLRSSPNHCSEAFKTLFWYDSEGDVSDILPEEDPVYCAMGNFNDFVASYKKERESPKGKDLFADAETYEEAYSNLIRNVFFNMESKNYEGVEFSVVDFHCESGRFSISNFRKLSYSDAYNALKAWNDDTKLERREWAKVDVKCKSGKLKGKKSKKEKRLSEYTYGLLSARKVVDLLKRDNNKANFMLERKGLLNSLFYQKQIPYACYRKALEVVDKYFVTHGKSVFMSEYYNSLSVVKAYLIRTGKEFYMVDETLRMKEENIPYLCGCWFATMVRLQRSASGNVGCDLSVRFYKMLKQYPAKAFAELNDMKVNYLRKLKSNQTTIGLAYYYENLFGDLAEKIGYVFPEKFSDLDKGSFDLGYCYQYHQLTKTKKEDGSVVLVDSDDSIE